jgi:hypothetical protein
MSISLAATAALADQKLKVEQYKAALHSVVSSASVEEAKLFVDHSERRAPRLGAMRERFGRPLKHAPHHRSALGRRAADHQQAAAAPVRPGCQQAARRRAHAHRHLVSELPASSRPARPPLPSLGAPAARRHGPPPGARARPLTALPAPRPPPARSALEKLQPRVVSFDEAVTIIRENLAELHEAEEDWSKAAQVLAGIDLDSGARLPGRGGWGGWGAGAAGLGGLGAWVGQH